jgi:hypothetical protein
MTELNEMKTAEKLIYMKFATIAKTDNSMSALYLAVT